MMILDLTKSYTHLLFLSILHQYYRFSSIDINASAFPFLVMHSAWGCGGWKLRKELIRGWEAWTIMSADKFGNSMLMLDHLKSFSRLKMPGPTSRCIGYKRNTVPTCSWGFRYIPHLHYRCLLWLLTVIQCETEWRSFLSWS